MGTRLFKNLLYGLKEIDDPVLPMFDVLHILEKPGIINDSDDWDRLREIGNNITYENPDDIDERVENINLAINGYSVLKSIFENTREYCRSRNLL